METVNISLPKTLARQVDGIVSEEGYASRSEFLRALVRFYLLGAREEMTLMPFRKASLARVKSHLRASGRYSEKFIKSVVAGLTKSSLYAKNKAAAR